jgi:hypothetical protein
LFTTYFSRRLCVHSFHLGPMLWFLKHFRRKIWRKKLRFFAQTTAGFCKKFITLVFEKYDIFSLKIDKNRRKLWS